MPLIVLLLCLACCLLSYSKRAQTTLIQQGEVWLNTSSNHIQAYADGIIKLKNPCYWYGELRSQSQGQKCRYVSCCCFKSLTNRKFRGHLMKLLPSSGVLKTAKCVYLPRGPSC